jgi:hypothetical protein
MAVLQAHRDRAAFPILVLAVGIGVALSRFARGLFGAAVLYVNLTSDMSLARSRI